MCEVVGNGVNIDIRERALEAFAMSVGVRYKCAHIKMDQLMRKNRRYLRTYIIRRIALCYNHHYTTRTIYVQLRNGDKNRLKIIGLELIDCGQYPHAQALNEEFGFGMGQNIATMEFCSRGVYGRNLVGSKWFLHAGHLEVSVENNSQPRKFLGQ